MRQTKKLVAAQAAIKALPSGQRAIVLYNATQEDYYQALEKAGFYWDAGSGKWEKGDDHARAQGKFSGSIFEDGEGLPSGVFRLRIMANDAELSRVCAAISRALVAGGMSIIEVSDTAYPNRRGAGSRVYMTGKMEAVP